MDCAEARRLLAELMSNRRSQSPADLARVAESIGYRVINSRRGSHRMAVDGPGPRFPIPTSKNPVRVGTVTSILRVLEEAVDRECGSS
jgi:predicted RNA binding protein YcfA (HicA-like mRNA interferase family)